MVQICILHDRNMYSIGTNLYFTWQKHVFYWYKFVFILHDSNHVFYWYKFVFILHDSNHEFYQYKFVFILHDSNHKFYWYTFLFILHDSNHVFYQYKFVFYMTVIMYSIGANFYFNLLSIYIVGIDKRFSDGCRGRSRILQNTERCNVNNKCWRLQPFYTSSCTNYAQECPWY